MTPDVLQESEPGLTTTAERQAVVDRAGHAVAAGALGLAHRAVGADQQGLDRLVVRPAFDHADADDHAAIGALDGVDRQPHHDDDRTIM